MIRISDDFGAFADQLALVPVDLRSKLRPRIRLAAQLLVEELRTRYSWSKRIPGAVRTRVGFGGTRGGGVLVFIDAKAAPHARPLEFGSQGRKSVNRHRVFGTNTWVDQPTRPEFMAGVKATEPKVVDQVQKAINEALGRL